MVKDPNPILRPHKPLLRLLKLTYPAYFSGQRKNRMTWKSYNALASKPTPHPLVDLSLVS